MYFSEFLETCTIGWVSFCKGGVGLFYFFGGDGTDRAGLGGGYIPRRWRLQPPAHPDRLHITGSNAGSARTRAGHARQGTHALTLDTLHLSVLDTRQAAPGRSGRRRALDCLRNVSETEQIRTLERRTKTGLKIITFSCMFVACATLQIH